MPALLTAALPLLDRLLQDFFEELDDLGVPGLLIATPIEFLGGDDNDESDS